MYSFPTTMTSMAHSFILTGISSFAVLTSAGNTTAQELPMPTIEDQNTHAALPQDQAFDMLGFKLLMKPDQLFALKSELSETEYDWRSTQENRGLRDGRGNEVSFSYGEAIISLKKKHSFDSIQIHLTSPLLGNRAYSVYRNVTFPDQVSVEALTKALKDKYGQPSFEGSTSSKHELNYVYHKGQRMEVDYNSYKKNKYSDADVRQVYNCFITRLDVSGSSRRVYRFKENRSKKHDGCNGGIAINLHFGKRNDLVKRMDMHIWDYDLAFKNNATQDIFLLEELNKIIAGQDGAAAPKL